MADSDVREPQAAGPQVRPDVQMFLDALKAIGGQPMNEMEPPAAREAYRQMGAMADVEPTPLAVIRDLSCPGPAGDIPLRLYDKRESREASPLILFIHGGGFVIGDLETHHPYCTALADALDLPVVAVDYRLAPEHPFPAAAEDCIAAARWIAGSPDALGRTVMGLVPTGDSAGGNLAIVVTNYLSSDPAAAPVVMQAPLYPTTGDPTPRSSFTEFAEGYVLTSDAMIWFGEAYKAIPGDPRHEALAHPGHSALPPTLLVTAGLDPLRDQGRAYAAHLIENGVDVTYREMRGTVHGFITMRKALPSAQADCAAIFAAMKAMLAEIG